MKTPEKHITIRPIAITDSDYPQVFELRDALLRKPIGLSLKDEDLSADANDIILAAEHNGTIVGCVMLCPPDTSGTVKLRQMAVAESEQGTGVGRMLVEGAEQALKNKGNKKIKLHARVTAEGFYKRLGYITVSDVFTEVGIPHVVMEKVLN